MKCDYCDSKFKEMPEDQVCPNCGAAIPSQKEQPAGDSRYPEPPIGVYEGNRAYVEVTKESVVFVRKGLLGTKDERVEVPFCEIMRSTNRRGYSIWPGVFFVHDKHGKTKVMYATSPSTRSMAMFIYYTEVANQLFEMIHQFCSACANINLGKEEWLE